MRILLALVLLTACSDELTFMQVCPLPDGRYQYPGDGEAAPRGCAATDLIWPALPLTVMVTIEGYTDSVAAAVDFWNAEVDRELFIIDADGIVEITAGSFTGSAVAVTYHLNDGGNLRAVIELRGVVDGGVAFRAFTHELGHVLALAHDAWPTSVMYPQLAGADGTFLVTDADCAAIHDRYF